MNVRKILVPLDATAATERVLPYAVIVAKQLQQPVTLLPVVADGADLNTVANADDATIAALIERSRNRAELFSPEVRGT